MQYCCSLLVRFHKDCWGWVGLPPLGWVGLLVQLEVAEVVGTFPNGGQGSQILSAACWRGWLPLGESMAFSQDYHSSSLASSYIYYRMCVVARII